MKQKFTDVYKDANSVTLNVTNNCNLHCTYCFEQAKEKLMMPPEIAIEAINKMYHRLDGREPFTINFFGGEPLLNWPTIKAAIDYCNKERLKVRYGITTNLTLLTDEMIDYFDDESIPVLVSIDGIKSVHDKNRCGSFDTTLNNIQRLIDKNLTIFIEARMTILPEDMKYAMDGVKMLYDMGINNFCPMPVTDVEWDTESLKDAKKFYTEVTQFFIDKVSDPNNTRNISIKNVDDLMQNILVPEINDPYMCPIFGDKWCTIDYRGDVYACHQGPTSEGELKDTLYIGNLDWVDPDKINNEIRKADYSMPECENCIGKSVCKCGCPVENMRENGKYTHPTKAYCELKKIMISSMKEKQEEIMNIESPHNRILTMVHECMKIKTYVDSIYNETKLSDTLKLYSQIQHVSEMLDNIDDNVLPTFRDYIDGKLKEILIALTVNDNVIIDDNSHKEEK